MFSIMKLCYYQIRGRGVMYGLSCGVMVIFILLGVFSGYNLQRGEPVIDERYLMSLLGVLIPFFSCFMILPFADEVMNTEFEETNFLFRNKIDILFLIQNLIYYFLILIIIVLFGSIYVSVFQISYQIYYLCIYLQLFTFVCYFITRSHFATCGILFFYLSVTIAFSLLGNQGDIIYLSDAANVKDSLDQELSVGWISAFGKGKDLFFKAQGWKMIVAVLAAVFSFINRRRLFSVEQHDRQNVDS